MKASKLLLYGLFFFLLMIVVPGVVVIVLWNTATLHARQPIHEALAKADNSLMARVSDRAHVLAQMNSSAYNLAKIFASKSDLSLSSFSEIEQKVVPGLFFALSTVRWASQIAYIGRNGLLFSYYNNENQIRAFFSNVSRSFNDSDVFHHMYIQEGGVDGARRGPALPSSSLEFDNCKWILDTLNGKNAFAAAGLGFHKPGDELFFFTAPVGERGVVSIGVQGKAFAEFITEVDLVGGHQYLALEDGLLLANTGPPHILYVLGNGSSSVHVINQDDTARNEAIIPCDTGNGTNSSLLDTNILGIAGKRYIFRCLPINASGIQMVSVMAFPYNDSINVYRRMNVVGMSLFLFLVVVFIIWSFILAMMVRRTSLKEIYLRAMLIKQKEATQQAERKSMNKSLAFASASHDIRTSLAGITGLIELCRADISPNSGMDRHLSQMSVCASKLLGILNSVLDTSKVEAGKVQLEEVQFDMAQVLEESIDIFHVVALRKGLDVIWDPTDFSVLRFSSVIGDCKRFKQILDNLLGNAVKFTSKGHIIVRAWAKKPSLESSKISSNQRYNFNYILDNLSSLFYKNKDSNKDLDAVDSAQHDPCTMEFVFEVDDTGIGIPKEKRASVFENYVQVKESSVSGIEGTGLGLGIVQSFVRLMGGEISIKDTEHGQRGTCFRFSIFLKAVKTSKEEETASPSHSVSGEYPKFPSSIREIISEKGFKMEGINMLLLVPDSETGDVMKKWLESLGSQVWVALQSESLHATLEDIKHKVLHTSSGSGKFDLLSRNMSSSRPGSQDYDGEAEISGIYKEKEQVLPLTTRELFRKPSAKGLSPSIVALIDLSFENVLEICSALKNFARNTQNIQFKVIWLSNSNTPHATLRRIEEAQCDLVLQKPFHGSRLYAIFKFLQECGGKARNQHFRVGSEPAIETNQIHANSGEPVALEKSSLKVNAPEDKPLNGMSILLVEDTMFLRYLASTMLTRLGATVKICENGLEALNLVKETLQETSNASAKDGKIKEGLRCFSYDVVLMDCEMPIMDGYEATRQIREEEKQYGCRIPIIALTAHATSEEAKKTIRSGMDFHLTKPLQANNLLEAICKVCQG